VSNVGFGEHGTHTTDAAEATVADQGLGELKHPPFVLRDASADQFTSKVYYIAKAKSLKLPWQKT
jgi:hypothetical protein